MGWYWKRAYILQRTIWIRGEILYEWIGKDWCFYFAKWYTVQWLSCAILFWNSMYGIDLARTSNLDDDGWRNLLCQILKLKIKYGNDIWICNENIDCTRWRLLQNLQSKFSSTFPNHLSWDKALYIAIIRQENKTKILIRGQFFKLKKINQENKYT